MEWAPQFLKTLAVIAMAFFFWRILLVLVHRALSLFCSLAACALHFLVKALEAGTVAADWLVPCLKCAHERLQAFMLKLAKSPEAQNRLGFAAALLLALVVLVMAQQPTGTVRPFGPKEQLTTTREIVLETKREGGAETYPIGTKVRALAQGPNGIVALIGESLEQCNVPFNAIKEAGGTPGEPVTTRTRQAPKAVSTINWDGPEGIWTGFATGDENIPSSNPAFEKRVVELTNAERAKVGLGPLVWDEDLARGARYTAADQYVQNYAASDHSTLDVYTDRRGIYVEIESAKSRIRKFIGDNSGAGENAAPRPSPEEAMRGWMASPGHRANILRVNINRIGVGFISGSGTPRFVQWFSK